MCLENGVHGRNMTVGGCFVQWCVTIKALGELCTFVEQKLNDSCVTILTAEMQWSLTMLIRFIENALETGSVEQLSACVVPSVPVTRENRVVRVCCG